MNKRLIGGCASLILALAQPLGALAQVTPAPTATGASEFRSVSATAGILLDGPSAKANKKFIAPKGMPLQVVSTVEPYFKVRDFTGYEGFIEKKSTSAQRTLISTALATVRASASESASGLIQAERGVLFEMLDKPANGWVKVKHVGGVDTVGFVRTSDVWGI